MLDKWFRTELGVQKSKKDLNFFPEYNLEEGLLELIKWRQRNQ